MGFGASQMVSNLILSHSLLNLAVLQTLSAPVVQRSQFHSRFHSAVGEGLVIEVSGEALELHIPLALLL